jgi:serine/threonine-protein kinase
MSSRELPPFIARYEIQATLGQGAMGTVYRARDPQLDRMVAIKTVRNDLGLSEENFAAFKMRFFQEAKAAGRLNHPNIVAFYDVMEVEHTPYIVMEYVESDTLANLIKARGALPTDQAVDITRQICLALDYAHAHGIVHRDIKPANILIGTKGEVKVSDFGIARIEGQDVTMTGAFLGTPSYMSPEQIRGSRVDGRSDLFSLGAVLYEALTGKRPFHGKDTVAVLHSIATDEPMPLHERNPLLPRGLTAVMARALAKDREQRYPNARAFADALGETATASKPGAAPVSPRSERPGGLLRTRGRQVAVIGACGVLLAVAGGIAWWRQAAPARVADVRMTPGPASGVPPAPADNPAPLKKPQTDERTPRDSGDKAGAGAPRPADLPVPATPPAVPPTPPQAVPPPPTPRPAVDVRPAINPQSALKRDRSEPARPTPPSVEPTPPKVEPTPPKAEPTPPRVEPAPPSAEPGPPRAEPERGGVTPPRPQEAHLAALPKAPAVAPAPPPAVPRRDIAGRWQGRYQCQGDQIGFSLNITSVDGNRIAAVFEFFPLPGTLSIPRGSFNMSGEYDRADGSIRLRSGSWVQRPLGFQSHDIEGQIEPNGEGISGRVLTTGCAHFVLARK